jgi:hypothetical protein
MTVVAGPQRETAGAQTEEIVKTTAFFNRVLAGGVLSLLVFGTATADDRGDMGGKLTTTIVKQDVFPVADKPGHVIVVGSSQGTNESTGKVPWMPGSKVVTTWVVDIVNGAGTVDAYSTFTLGKDVESSHSVGKYTTAMSPDGKTPLTTQAGTWQTVSGSGAWAGASGSGSWKTTVTSPTQSVSEWSGHKEKATAQR